VEKEDACYKNRSQVRDSRNGAHKRGQGRKEEGTIGLYRGYTGPKVRIF
jgi:hypothetical protein